MSTEQLPVTDRILVYDVDTKMSDKELRKEILSSYQGIKYIKRLYYNDEKKTPRDRIEIKFTSPKYAQTILEEGVIIMNNLRCQVIDLKPTTYLKTRLESDHGSDCQSEVFTEEQEITDKILMHDVPTKIPVNDLEEELSKMYEGVKHVKRWYEMNGSQTPTERVQVDFESAEHAGKVLQSGFIKIGPFYCFVTGLKPSRRLWNQLHNDYGSDYQSEISAEEDQVTDRILVCKVPITIDENFLQKRLSKNYPGIKQIIRWCFDDDCQFRMVCVEIDFISPSYTRSILRDGFIIDGKVSYNVKPLQSSVCPWNGLESDSGSDYPSRTFSQ
jgi:hypothetical protein